MFQDKYVFAQLTAFLNRSKFNRIVAKYDGDKYVKFFTCWNQLLTLMFGQLCNRESLRDLIVAIEAHANKTYHLGLGRNVTKVILQKLIKIETTESLKILLIISSMKHVRNVPLISSDLMVTYMPLIPRQ